MPRLFGVQPHTGVPPSVLDELAGVFAKTHSDDDDERSAAKQTISRSAGMDSVLAFLALAGSADHEDATRLDASVHVSDILLRRWPSSPNSVDRRYFLPNDRPIIEGQLWNVFIDAPPRIQAQLAEAVGAAAAFDPVDWAPPFFLSIMDWLDTALRNHDFAASSPLLAVLSSLFSRAAHLDPLLLPKDFAALHLNLFEDACSCFQGQPGGGTCSTFELLRHCCDIFYWLKSVHLPDYFEDRYSEWSRGFYIILQASRSGDVEDIAALIRLQIAVVRILQLYIEREQEEFMGELETSLLVVRDLFLQVAAGGGDLVLAALRVFTTATEKGCYFQLLNDRLCVALVDMLWPKHEDKALFHGNPMEYIKCDSEGSDADTLRWAACRLLRVVVLNSSKMYAVVSKHFKQVLHAYEGQAKNWKETYVEIYLLITFMNKPDKTRVVDMDTFYTFIIIFESKIAIFFEFVIVPELKAPDWKSEPMLKAAVLKFLKEYMPKMPKAIAWGLLPSVVRFLLHDSSVVRSYAATFVENLLIIKDADDINLHAPTIAQNLSAALRFPDSLENPFIIKCLMRVLGMANITGLTAHNVTSRLVVTLTELCNNPKDSEFSYFLFEALATMIGQGDGHDLKLLTIFEACLYPVLWMIMDKGIIEFWPSAIQTWAQLVDFSRVPLSQNDKKLFGVLVSNVVWDLPSCVPAMLCLLRAFFHKFADELHQVGLFEQFVQFCCGRLKVISSEDSAIKMLNILVGNVSRTIIEQYMLSIWSVLFDRARHRRVPEYLNSLGLFMALVVEKYGLSFLLTSTNNKSWCMLDHFLEVCWIPNLELIKGAQVKQAVIFSTKLLCSYQGLLCATAPASELWLWGKLLDGTITLLSDQDGGEQEHDDCAEFLVRSLAKLSAESPGRFLPIIQKYVKQVNQIVLNQLCATHNSNIV